jgi:hypothetical protein
MLPMLLSFGDKCLVKIIYRFLILSGSSDYKICSIKYNNFLAREQAAHAREVTHLCSISERGSDGGQWTQVAVIRAAVFGQMFDEQSDRLGPAINAYQRGLVGESTEAEL